MRSRLEQIVVKMSSQSPVATNKSFLIKCLHLCSHCIVRYPQSVVHVICQLVGTVVLDDSKRVNRCTSTWVELEIASVEFSTSSCMIE